MHPIGFSLVSITAIAFGIARFFIPVHGLQPEDIFKDMAHLFIGGLFAAWLALRFHPESSDVAKYDARFFLRVAVLLTFVEIAAFFLRR